MAKPVRSVSDLYSVPTQSIVAGIGCRQGAAAAEIIALVERALAAGNQQASALVAVATLDRKSREAGLLAAAAHFGVPLRTFSAHQLAVSEVGSAKIEALVGTSSVAEAAALRAGALLTPRLKSANATCALAAAGAQFDLCSFGHPAAGNTPASTASMAASSSLTSSAGP